MYSFADEEDGVELPSKIVNEDLRKFFMPKKYAEPEPIPEPVPEVGQSQAFLHALPRLAAIRLVPPSNKHAKFMAYLL